MKRYFIILILLFFCFGFSSPHHRIIARKNAAVPSCYDCSTTGWLLWEMNSTTVGEGSPCGCSDVDTSASGTGDVSISGGQYILDDTVSADGLDGYRFDGDAAIDDLATVFIKLTIDTWVDETFFFYIYVDANSNIYAELQPSSEIKIYHEGNTAGTAITTTDANLSTSTAYIFRLRWRTSDNDPNLTINAYNTSMVEQGTGASSNTNLTTFATQPTTNDLVIGNMVAVAGAKITYEYIHIYNAWLDTDPNG